MKFNKDFAYVMVIIVLLGLCGQFYYDYHYKPLAARAVDVYYNGDIETNKKLVKTIQDADDFVYFAIYTFTRKDVKDALLGAKHRGVDVRGLTDKTQIEKIELQSDIIKELRNSGIPISVQDHSAIMHLKTLVTEDAYFSGSYNWTASATDSNDEVIEIGRDENIRKQYKNILEKLFDKYAVAKY
jgi:phosphatidylserine/phosphatidylglycerophosphate/cardiolipin synthase-like enzyme